MREAALTFFSGDLGAARRFIEDAYALGAAGGDSAIGGVSLTGMAWIYRPWFAAVGGDLDAARSLAAQGVAWSAGTGKPSDRAFALQGSVIALIHARAVDEAMRQVEELVALTDAHKLRVLHASGLMYQAWLTRLAGDAATAARQARLGLEIYETIGQRILLNSFRAVLAEAEADAGDLDVALATAASAVAVNDVSPVYAAEVLRVQAAIQARLGRIDAARATLGEAIAAANRTGAALFAREAETALARLA
jgi:tetratricopeptide (TPR) repeat protein